MNPGKSPLASRRLRPRACRLRPVVLWCAMLAASDSSYAQAPDLTSLNLEQLLEISVVGASKYEQKQSDVAAAVSVITRQEIAAFGWRTLSEALASLPGTYTTYDRQYTYLGTRGFGLPGDFNTRTLLTINGNRVNDGVYDQAYVGGDFPLDMQLVERIEFIPGPGGAVYGQNAMLGTVNVVTRSGAAIDGGELTASYEHTQALGESRASWGKLFDNGSDVLVSVSGRRAQGQDRFMTFGESGIAGVAAGLDGGRDAELFARAARGPWSFELVHGNRRKDDPTGVYLSDPLAPGTYQRDRMSLAQLQHQHDFGGDLGVSTRLFLGRERYIAPETFSGEATASGASSDWQGVESRLLVNSWSRHKVMFGAEYQNNAHQDQTFDNFVQTPDQVDTEIRRSGWRAGVYVQDEVRLAQSLNATLGVRADRNNTSNNALSPRVGLTWQATPATAVKALYGRAYRAPNVYERDYDDGEIQAANPDLRGEQIDTTEVVIDRRVGRSLALRASVYEWLMRQLIVQGVDTADMSMFENGEDVRARGVELSADKTWGWGGRLRGSASYQNVAYASGGRPDNSPRFLQKLNFWSPVTTGVRIGYESQCSSARQAIDGSLVDGYCLSNLHMAAQPRTNGLSLAFTLGNVFNAAYAHPGSGNNWQTSLEQDGRSARVEASYRF